MPSADATMPGTLFVVLLLSLPLLVILPSFLLAAYKRALNRWMGASADPDPPETEAPRPPPGERSNLSHPPYPWRALARSRQVRCALVYAAAGASAAASLTLALMGESGVHSPSAFLTIFVVNLWPVLLSLGVIFRWSRPIWMRAILLYSCILGLIALRQHLLGAMAGANHGKAGAGIVLLLFIMLNTLATIFFRAMSLRNTRQIGPTLMPFCVALVMGPQLLLHVGNSHFSFALWIARLSIHLRLTNLGGIVFVVLAAMLFMALLGRGIAFTLVALYRDRHVSDQTLLLDALWLLFIAFPAIVLLTRTGHETGSGAAWVLAVFPLYFVVAHVGLLLFTPRPRTPAPSLLVLRAFTLQQRAEAIFQPLTTLWRYLGPVRLIGGPDLASTTVEPGVFLEFVSGRLGDLFIRSLKDFNARKSQLSPTPDPDGRFRIDDFFCFKTAWQPAVSDLLRGSDVILADFRGLSKGRHGGCDWEIQEIARSSSLARCVFLLDGPEDDLYLRATLTAALPIPLDPATTRILHPAQLNDRPIEDLFSTLLQSVQQAPNKSTSE